MKIRFGFLLVACFEIAIISNLIILDLILFSGKKPTSITTPTLLPVTPTPTECGVACMNEVERLVEKAIANLLPAKTTTIEKTTTTLETRTPTKEFFIPFGSGSTQNDQWEDLPGVESYIDTGNYTKIQTVYFEVSMKIPTKNGVASARLYNVTDKHPVWYSEVSTDSDVSTLVASKISLDKGNKQYRVQMRTSLKYPSLLDFARVKIITK